MSYGQVKIQTQAEAKKNRLIEEKALFSNLIYEWLERKKSLGRQKHIEKKSSLLKSILFLFSVTMPIV